MSVRTQGLFSENKKPVTVKHVLKPKWLSGVSVEKHDDYFKVCLWKSGYVIIKSCDKVKSTYRHAGSANKKEVNLLGEKQVDFTTKISGLDVNQCFSISKPILINRIKTKGNNGELEVRYEELDYRCVALRTFEENSVIVSTTVLGDEEVVLNDMAISALCGPDNISKKYGKPDVRVRVAKCDDYNSSKSIKITDVVFTWGDSSTRYKIIVGYYVESRQVLIDIVVR